MILLFTRHPNRHRFAPMRVGFALRCKNTVFDVSIQRRIWRIDYDSFNNCVSHNKQIGLYSVLIDRIKTQIPIGRFLNRGLR
jgi:hypothetical protein